MVNMKVDVGGGLILRNPVLTASGTCGYGLELEPFLDLSRLGGIVVKGLSPQPRAGNPPARICETPSGMLNAIGLQNIGVDAFVRERLPALRRHATPVVANVFGETYGDYDRVADALAGAEGLAGVELNLSCPNTAEGGMIFGVDPRAVERITRSVRGRVRVPVWVKLTPNVTDIREIARAAVAGGADALCLVNTFVGMAIDVRTRRSLLANGSGGLSGPAIRPLAVWLVHQVARAVTVPVIGMGGIVSGRDAAEFLLAGARAVQVGTATFNEPAAGLRILEELEAYCVEQRVEDLNELVGALRRPE
jgi:dihydroorotate dehydrogenase (NAD+) catalytic subunit